MTLHPRAVAWPNLVPEAPIQQGPLAVYPLLSSAQPPDFEPGYVLLDPAMDQGLAEVKEVDEQGRVPTIALFNRGILPILAIQGQELVGAKQNRTLNVSILAPRGRTEIPVTCVEQGRWGYKGAQFRSGNFEHYMLRKMKAEMVYAAAKRAPAKEHGYAVSQIRVWDEVERESARHGVRSSTAALHDVYASGRVAARLEDFDSLQRLPEGTVGVAVAISGELVAAEFMETPEAFSTIWPSILKGYSLSALSAEEKPAPDRMDAQMFAAMPGGASPVVDDSVGLGGDLRWEGREFLAAALAHEDRLLHGTVFARGD